jgi:hypothetical protein
VAAECVWRPLIERGAIEAHTTASGVPDSDEQPHQRRLAGTAGPDDAETLAGLKLKPDVLYDCPLRAGRHDADVLDGQAVRGCLQLHPRHLRG